MARKTKQEAQETRQMRICRKLNIKSTIKYSNNGCTRQSANPQYIAENILNREFTAKAPNEKWLTDVTEFHYYIGMEKHKIYLSAILDLCGVTAKIVVNGRLGPVHWRFTYFIILNLTVLL